LLAAKSIEQEVEEGALSETQKVAMSQ